VAELAVALGMRGPIEVLSPGQEAEVGRAPSHQSAARELSCRPAAQVSEHFDRLGAAHRATAVAVEDAADAARLEAEEEAAREAARVKAVAEEALRLQAEEAARGAARVAAEEEAAARLQAALVPEPAPEPPPEHTMEPAPAPESARVAVKHAGTGELREFELAVGAGLDEGLLSFSLPHSTSYRESL
jgi:cell division protein FtsL